MAFRIHESVLRGEIDNRVKGLVRGKIWIAGVANPVELELAGNACSDLAGCLLTFSNPSEPTVAADMLEALDSCQRGTVGDLTASRKVRVFDVPLQSALEMIDRDEKPPEHIANCLYLEWFSEANGRVVIESTDFELTISTPEWRMTPDDESERAQQSASGMDRFMKKLTEAVDHQRRELKNFEEPWDEHDYEKFLKERDVSLDKYIELLDKYGDSEDADEKIAKEMGWDKEEGNLSAEQVSALCEDSECERRDPNPAREGIDWIRTEDGDLRHPLQHRCFESGVKFRQQIEDLGIILSTDRDLDHFILEFHIAAAKLAGALGTVVDDSATSEPAFIVACLKRALDHLHKSLARLEPVATKRLIPEQIVTDARTELLAIREGILQLMDKYRGRTDKSSSAEQD